MAKISKDKLSSVIRKIVREEVAMAIHEVITELKQPVQVNENSQHNVKKVNNNNTKKKFSDNPVLNDILNETANDGSMEEWKNMGGQTFDSSKINQVMQSSYGDVMGGSPNIAQTTVGKNGAPPPKELEDVLNRDYSKLLKKVDEKAKSSRGG
jgi:hypothetical protein